MCAMLLLFYASGTVEGVAFDADCDSSNTCSELNNECISSKCVCTSGSFRNTAGNACASKVALDAVCVDNGVPTGQCIDNLAECTNDGGWKCSCKAANYKSGSECKVKVAIGMTCDIADTATDQCSDTKTACSDDGNGAKKCLCTSDYYVSSTTCLDRKAPNATCSTGQCVTNAMCSASSICACKTGYEATPIATPTSCESSDAAIIIAHMYVFIFGIVASLYFLV